MLWLTCLQQKNGLARTMKYHTLVEYGREVTASAVTYRPKSETSGNPLSTPLLYISHSFLRARQNTEKYDGQQLPVVGRANGIQHQTTTLSLLVYYNIRNFAIVKFVTKASQWIGTWRRRRLGERNTCAVYDSRQIQSGKISQLTKFCRPELPANDAVRRFSAP
ncbi:hypothetical protein EVAR_5490_1 [Eumeta japonica]|uniref:Uncharacterized protein n=1 Tax=Eumeta variegata TaxID=151549 RepID=A0A4C1T8S0_EUMVA|nr:hypothetical protein EVAR_5490_1 [Eumeta japonica]